MTKHIKQLFQAGRRIIVLGDLHGEFDVMSKLLDKLSYEENNDLLISVGDLIDRGSESKQVFDFFHSHPYRHAVMGNHEDMLLHAIENPSAAGMWMANGGQWAINETEESLIKMGEQIDEMPTIIEIELDSEELVGIVHAQVPTAFNDWDEFKTMATHYAGARNKAIWERHRAYKDCRVVTGVDLVVVGHSVLAAHALKENHLFIDTGSIFRNDTNNYKLTALVLDADTPLKRMRIVCQ